MRTPLVLRIQRRRDGALGRPRRHRLHQRPADRPPPSTARAAPGALFVTRDDRIIMASEMGVLPIPEKDIVTKWRLQPGKMLLVDLDEGRLIPDEELKATLARSHPYKEWLNRNQIVLETCPPRSRRRRSRTWRCSIASRPSATPRRSASADEPMGAQGRRPPAPWATTRRFSALSSNRSCCSPISSRTSPSDQSADRSDREELVMSLVSSSGRGPNLVRARRRLAPPSGSRCPSPNTDRGSLRCRYSWLTVTKTAVAAGFRNKRLRGLLVVRISSFVARRPDRPERFVCS